MSPSGEARSVPWGRRSFLALPLVVFASIAALLGLRLGDGDPALLPSVLIGRPAPNFDLPAIAGLGVPGLAARDLRAGHVSLVNVFASWCVECHAEHDALLALAQDPDLKAEGVTLVGLSYKDAPADAQRYLASEGNPFAAVGNDAAGRTGIDFGVYGVPETYVVKGDGTIAFKLVGGVTERNLPAFKAEIAKAMR
ncbi:DsbE family thiol:disulfide interchange protein [Lichenihabitans sp. Uapishka_5]|uniref:DsbE family thiol:disulfide interchange protein n=1 Tax=Lichenihabitans sp. Uapishka_5 TaxID=3037302 RepID=UPI0029E82536|nr:DsbE family thiol:disulfide interchange protein [Lichenihabitans sp. Uapishka_5]MDX7953942.1 DsbE family thiol:disulfide interchange protein [Lichenihabitans sp. Uapishka_5]